MPEQGQAATVTRLWVAVSGVYHLCTVVESKPDRFFLGYCHARWACGGGSIPELPPGVWPTTCSSLMVCSINDHRIHGRRMCKGCKAAAGAEPAAPPPASLPGPEPAPPDDGGRS